MKSQITRLQIERDELVKVSINPFRSVKKLAQFATYVEQAVSVNTECADAVAFCAALHQLQEELKVFEK
jgi:hypothetical protein